MILEITTTKGPFRGSFARCVDYLAEYQPSGVTLAHDGAVLHVDCEHEGGRADWALATARALMEVVETDDLPAGLFSAAELAELRALRAAELGE